MTEKEKMSQGLAYDAIHDSQLRSDRVFAKQLCFEYNLVKEGDYRGKVLLKVLLGSIGQNPNILPSFWCDYGYNIKIGDNFFANHNLTILDPGMVTIGNDVLVGPNCGFYTAVHPLDSASRLNGVEFAKPISIGNNVWIGGNVVILPGVKIGDNAVIGAGSVVTKDIPNNVVAYGNPCRVVKEVE